jgi:hypothetical protein
LAGCQRLPHFAAKAKRVIYFHMVGGPSQMDLYDYKPVMNEWYDKDLPESVRDGQRLTTMTSGQTRFPIAPSKYKFEQHGESWDVGQRVVAIHIADGRRHVLHSIDAHRSDQPRTGDYADAVRQSDHRPSVHRFVACRTVSVQ